MTQIQISPQVYEKVQELAARRQQTPDRFVEDLLVAQLLPPHPYVEVVQGHGQPRAVLKGTRIGVDVIVGYIKAGYAPQEIVTDVLPHVTLAQLYDALSYYEDHRVQIEAVLDATPEIWQARLRERFGEAAAQLLGK